MVLYLKRHSSVENTGQGTELPAKAMGDGSGAARRSDGTEALCAEQQTAAPTRNAPPPPQGPGGDSALQRPGMFFCLTHQSQQGALHLPRYFGIN